MNNDPEPLDIPEDIDEEDESEERVNSAELEEASGRPTMSTIGGFTFSCLDYNGYSQ